MDNKKRVRKTNKSHTDSTQAHVANAAKMKQAVLAVINENIKIIKIRKYDFSPYNIE